MRFYKTRHEYVFSTGKKLYAHHGIIGIAPDKLISSGYDEGIQKDALTFVEKIELADYIIKLWTKWRATAQKSAMLQSTPRGSEGRK